MEPIVIPRVLNELMACLDGSLGRPLSLDYAEHALAPCREIFEPAQAEATFGYIETARLALAGERALEDLIEARQVFFGTRGDGRSLADRVGWIATLAVNLCFLRDYQAAQVVLSPGRPPGLRDVAGAAQKVAADWARHTSEADNNVAAHIAKWEESRWQLTRLIAVVPVLMPGPR